jgi:hypothetical protein
MALPVAAGIRQRGLAVERPMVDGNGKPAKRQREDAGGDPKA